MASIADAGGWMLSVYQEIRLFYCVVYGITDSNAGSDAILWVKVSIADERALLTDCIHSRRRRLDAIRFVRKADFFLSSLEVFTDSIAESDAILLGFGS